MTVWVLPRHSRTRRAPDLTRIGRDDDTPVGLQFLGHRRELALRRLAQAAIRKLLHAIGDGADQQVAAQPWRLTAIEPAPLVTQLLSGQAPLVPPCVGTGHVLSRIGGYVVAVAAGRGRLRTAFMLDLRCFAPYGRCHRRKPGTKPGSRAWTPRSQQSCLFRMHALRGQEVQSKMSGKSFA